MAAGWPRRPVHADDADRAGPGTAAFQYLISFFTWLATGYSEFGQQGRVPSGYLPWLGAAFSLLIPADGGLVYGPLPYLFAREARRHGSPGGPGVMIAVAGDQVACVVPAAGPGPWPTRRGTAGRER